MAYKHVINFSGGVCSYLAAKRVVEDFGNKDVVLLFANTHMEDEDLYRFVDQASDKLNVDMLELADGRTPWEIFKDVKFLGNSRIDPCSRMLKRELLNRWVKENCDVDDCTIYIGLDWSEIHRIDRFKQRMVPWVVEAPLAFKPYLNKKEMLAEVLADGIKPPRLYDMGFPHNNCGGFCVKAGQAQFRLLLDKMPERYAFHEQKEKELAEYLGKKVTILRKVIDGVLTPITLTEFRQMETYDCYDWGGCGCAIE